MESIYRLGKLPVKNEAIWWAMPSYSHQRGANPPHDHVEWYCRIFHSKLEMVDLDLDFMNNCSFVNDARV